MIQTLDIIEQSWYRSTYFHSTIFSGAFVPLTMEGNILVDGVLASCYASFDHDIQHVIMKPLLWFPSMMDVLLGEENYMHSYVTILEDVAVMMS